MTDEPTAGVGHNSQKAPALIARYRELTGVKAQIAALAAEKTGVVTSEMDDIKTQLFNLMADAGTTQLKTESGTAAIKTTATGKVTDWDKARAYILANEAYELLPQSINRKAAQEHIDEHKCIIPGFELGGIKTLSVTKPAVKKG